MDQGPPADPARRGRRLRFWSAPLVGFVIRDAGPVWNQVVIRSNDFHAYFRVNLRCSGDPNVYGRYLALAITMVAAALLWRSRAASR